jgi:hypothetical protein
MLIPELKILMVVTGILMAVFSVGFYTRQRSGEQIGGSIAPAKALWLFYAMYVWFILTPIIAFEPKLSSAISTCLLSFAGFMWVRAFVELFMMYVSKNWKPPYGIAHNITSFVLLAGLSFTTGAWSSAQTPLDHWALGLITVLLLCMVLETIYATVFHKVIGDHTTGDDAVWFAPANSPHYQRIVSMTKWCNLPLYLFLIVFVGVCSLGDLIK